MSEKNFWEGYQQAPVKPAQQEPRIDIYRSFEQWKRGNVLEHGVPRTEHYSEAQLDLVEMGWNYGYDAGRAVEQALDKKAENARELGLDYEPAQQEPVAWICEGSSSDEKHAIDYWPGDVDDLPIGTQLYTQAQRTWVGLSDAEIHNMTILMGFNPEWVAEVGVVKSIVRNLEVKLKEKNNG
jgi:hypothetical protein